jgi:hypothetical protein
MAAEPVPIVVACIDVERRRPLCVVLKFVRFGLLNSLAQPAVTKVRQPVQGTSERFCSTISWVRLRVRIGAVHNIADITGQCPSASTERTDISLSIRGRTYSVQAPTTRHCSGFCAIF